MKTDRSLGKYIILTLITFGIYSLFFWHEYARDMNIICAGDGKNTRGILFRIIISILTLGIYEWIWLYSAGERIEMNAHARNVYCNTTGTNVLLWYILGVLIIIGPFIGLHKLINGINVLAADYNAKQNAQRHGVGPNVTINNIINN